MLFFSKANFDHVIGLIDGMVVTLAKEQDDDDSHKEYCREQFDKLDDKKKTQVWHTCVFSETQLLSKVL